MKFEAADSRYLDRRRDLAERLGFPDLWSLMDQWPLYCGIANLARSLAVVEIVRETLTVPGDIAEFGSWQGANAALMAKALQIYDSMTPKVVHSFDSFEGLSRFTIEDGSASEAMGAYRGDLERFKAFLDLYELADAVEIHVGLIEETLPSLLQRRKELSFSLVYCDTDLYQSTLVVLEQAHPRLAIGGVFLLDEWNLERFPGESVAVREFMERHGDEYEMESVRHTRQPTLILRRQRASR